MESKIPKEKLKVGKLYKTLFLPKLPSSQYLYRVWMGNQWSMGTLQPRKQEWSIYNVPADPNIQETIIVVNTRATPFKLPPAQTTTTQSTTTVDFNGTVTGSLWSVANKQLKKPIRYLNRP